MNEVVQDASKSGNALKTLSANFSGLTTSASDGTVQLTKAGIALQELAGIEIWDKQTGQVKDMFTAMDELHGKWDDLTEAEQVALGTTLAGKTQLNTFNALMSNWETAKQLVSEYKQGLTIGSAEQENLRYLDSINGKWNVIKENMKGIATTLVSSDIAKGFLDGVVAITDGLNTVTKVGTNLITDIFSGDSEKISGNLYNTIEKAFGGLGDFGGKLAATFSDLIGETLTNPIFEKVMGMTSLGKAFAPLKGLFDIFNTGSESRELQNQINDRKQNIQGIESEIQALKNQKAAIDTILPSYDELSKKTNRSAQENQQLAEMRNQLAEMNPDLVLGYDSDGSPILKNLQLQNQQLEAQIKLKQQSQRVEENALALDVQKQRIDGLKEYNKALEEYNDTVSVLDTNRKENIFGQQESLQEYAQRIQEGNAKILQSNQEAYQKRLADHQKYIEDEKAIQEKYINQMESSNTFAKMTDDMKSGMLTFMDALDWSQFSDLDATKFTNQLSQLGDKFVSTTADMGKHGEAIAKLTSDYANGQINLEKYTQGLTEQYEAAGKFDAESFSNWRTALQSYVDTTGDLEGANRVINEMATSLNKVTGIDTSTWKTALSFDPAPIDASNKALQKFLNNYGTGIQNLGKGGLADTLTSQFETLQASYMQMTSDLAGGKEIDVEYLVNAKINQPEPIGNLIDKIIEDEEVNEKEIEILLNAQAELLNTGEISQETISQIAEEFNMTEAEVVAMLNVKTEVKETGEPLEKIKQKWDSLDVGEKVLSLIQKVMGGDLFSAAKAAWDGLSIGEKIQNLIQKATGSDLLGKAKEVWNGLSIGEKIQTLVQMATGSNLLTAAKTVWDGLNIGEKVQSLIQKATGSDLLNKAKGVWDGLNIGEKVQSLLQKTTGGDTLSVAKGVWDGLNIGEKVQSLVQKVMGKDDVESAKQSIETLPKEKTVTVSIKQAGANLINSIADWIKSKTTTTVEVEAKVGKVDTSAISNIKAPTIEIKANAASALTQVGAIRSALDGIQSKSVSLNVVGNAQGQVTSIKNALAGIQPKAIAINVSGNALTQVNSIKNALLGIQPKNITVSVSGNALVQINSIRTALNGIQPKNITVNASGNALTQINTVKSALAGLQSKSISVNATVNGTNQVNALKAAIASLQGKSVNVSAKVTGTDQVKALTSAINTVKAKTVNVTAQVTGTSQVKALTSAINTVKSKSVRVSATVSGTSAVRSLASAIASVRSKSVRVSATKTITTIQKTVAAKKSATPMLTNTSLSSIPVSMSASTSMSSSPTVTASDAPTPIDVPVNAKASSSFDISKILSSLNFDANMFEGLEDALKRLSGELEHLNEKAEETFGSKKIELLEQQIPLLRQQQKIQEQIASNEKQQNNELVNWLSQEGFEFDNLGNLTNYNDKLSSMEQNVKSLKETYDLLNNSQNKNKDAINSSKNAYESANEILNKAKGYLDEYLTTNNREITVANEKWLELENTINKINKEIEESKNNLSMESLKKGLQESKQLLGEYGDELKEIDKEFSYNSNADEIDYMNQKQEELNKKLKEQEQLYQRTGNSISELQKNLSKYGFVVGNNKVISNYEDILKPLEGTEEFERARKAADDYMSELLGGLKDIQVEATETKATLDKTTEDFQEALDKARQERLEPFKNTLTKVRHELDKVNDSIDLLDSINKFAIGDDKLTYLQNKLELLNEKFEATKEELGAVSELINRTSADLWQYGFRLDENSMISNYDTVLDKLLGTSEYENAKKVADEYMELIRNDYAQIERDLIEAQNERKEVYNEMLDITKEIEEKITDVIKKEADKRKEEIEKYTEERIELLEKEKEAYDEMRSEQEYKSSISDQINEIDKLNRQIETARRDTTVGGAKRLQELTEELNKAQKELEEMTQEKIDDDFKNNLDKEINRLEEEEDRLISILDEKFSDENIAKMIKEGLTSGFIELNDEVLSIQELLIKSVDESIEGYSVMSNVIKNELVANLNIALETMESLSNVYSNLGVENFSNPSVNTTTTVPLPSGGGQAKSIMVGDTNITVHGSVDNATLAEIEQLIKESQDEMLDKIARDL